MMRIREARSDDLPRLLQVHRLAFDGDEEAALVGELLRDDSARPSLSLAADEQGALVGHALFTALRLTGAGPETECAILAPLAVVPSHQRAGVGQRLIEHGCQVLARRGIGLVFVLGDPAYYTRRGFRPARPQGLSAPYAITPDEAWMVRPLREGVLGHASGTASCARSLMPRRYWVE